MVNVTVACFKLIQRNLKYLYMLFLFGITKIHFNFSKCKSKILQIILYEYSLVFILVMKCSPLCIGGGGDYLFSLLHNVNKHNELHGLKFSKIKNREKRIYPTSENQLVRIWYTA